MDYRILIVDDEPIVLKWLCQLVEQSFEDSVKVIGTGNSLNAKNLIDTIQFDIAILDINMPNISGLELLNHITANKHITKVIFLTGQQSFEYVLEAMKKNVVAYVLKTEDDEVLLSSISKAMRLVDNEVKNRILIDEAECVIKSSESVIKKEFLLNALRGQLEYSELVYFSEQINLSINMKNNIYLVFGTLIYEDNQTKYNLLKEFFAISVVVIEKLSPNYLIEYVMIDDKNWVWLLQPKNDTISKEDVSELLFANLENAQNDYHRNLKKNFVIAYTKEPVPIRDIPNIYSKIKAFKAYISKGIKLLITFDELVKQFDSEDGLNYSRTSISNQVMLLEKFLSNGDKKLFLDCCESLFNNTNDNHYNFAYAKIEKMMSLFSVLLSHINQTGIYKKINCESTIEKLNFNCANFEWSNFAKNYKELAENIFDYQVSEKSGRGANSIESIKQYIKTHLSEDLSLTTLSQKIYFNSCYFSSLFKEHTGMNVSEYIKIERLRKSKTLLGSTDIKISEISKMMGYENATYFSRMYRQCTGMSPQEYRNKCKQI